VIAAPIVTRDGVAATLLALTASERSATAELTRSVGEVARQLGLQLELGMIERRRRQLRDARLAALQSQMSPHFVYNTITAIASLVRTDPEQARELLFRFAELCRYVLRQGPLRTTLAEELRIVHVYVELERARKRADLEIVFRIDPATLAAPLPMMTLQPLVENAVQHGLAAGATGGRGVVTVEAHDRGHEMVLTVSDNGCGIEPDALDRLRRSIDPQRPEPTGSQASVALVNVADRLEAAHGSGARLEIESSAGAGTAVRLRLPKDGTGGDR
jgi:two-component system LytT family sensor kinase